MRKFYGIATQKSLKKTEKKTVPNFKFAVAFGFLVFPLFFGIFGFCGTFLVFFFGLNFSDKKFKRFKNHAIGEVLRGKVLPTHVMYLEPIEL